MAGLYYSVVENRFPKGTKKFHTFHFHLGYKFGTFLSVLVMINIDCFSSLYASCIFSGFCYPEMRIVNYIFYCGHISNCLASNTSR